MLSMFQLARNLSVTTWYHNTVHMGALCTLVQKQAIATSTTTSGSSKTKVTKTSASKARTSADLSIGTSIRAATESKQLDTRSPPRSSKRFLWTDEKDAVLREGIAMHRKDGLAKVADFVGGGVTYHQCLYRASYLGVLANKGVKRGAWDQEEMRRLEELVPQYLVRSYWSTKYKKMTEEYTDWEGVGEELGRLPHDCNNKWRRLQCAKLKKGRFTTEEDALVKQRVTEWEGKGSGLWTALQKEMGRAAVSIQQRWKTITSTFQLSDTTIYWTDDLDERLKEGIAKHKAEGWAKVTEYMGGGVTALQCENRWGTYLGAMQHGTTKRGAWDQEEVDKLAELVPQHVVPSYWSVRCKRMTKEHIDWIKVAAKLGRLPVDCHGKWRLLLYAKMKKGPFTDSEIAMIRERVKGWETDRTRCGLWAGLQKDLDRPAQSIRSHWVDVLSKE